MELFIYNLIMEKTCTVQTGKHYGPFEVAEIDGLYEPASAEVEGDYIKVYSDKIKNPRYVRYGWQPFTRANLVNDAELPASTFRAGNSGISCQTRPYSTN